MEFINLGLKDYSETLTLQHDLLVRRIAGDIGDTLLLVEHPHVYTVGRAVPDDQIPSQIQGVAVHKVERGGRFTYHGPGQLVGYPIFQIAHRDIRRYIKDLEKVLIRSLESVGVPARPCPQSLELEPGQLETGVWAGNKKMGSLGISVKHWVSYHGFSLNLDPAMEYFDEIHPCGFDSSIMSSITAWTGHDRTQYASILEESLLKGFQELSTYYEKVREVAQEEDRAFIRNRSALA